MPPFSEANSGFDKIRQERSEWNAPQHRAMSEFESKADFAGARHQYAKEPNVKLINQQPVARTPMQTPPLDPDVADTAPSDFVLTAYDEEHLITYLRLLDADVEGADWREVARIVLHLDPEHEADRARRAFESHLSRARWNDGAWLPAPATWWCVRLKRPCQFATKKRKTAYGRSKAETIRRRRDRLKRSCVPTFVYSSEGTNPAITACPAIGRLP